MAYTNFERTVNIVSSWVSAPPWNIDLTPFYLGPPKKLQICQTPPLWATPLKILENLTPPPLEMYLVQKSRDSFFKETKYFISNNEIRAHLNVEIWIYSCKI